MNKGLIEKIGEIRRNYKDREDLEYREYCKSFKIYPKDSKELRDLIDYIFVELLDHVKNDPKTSKFEYELENRKKDEVLTEFKKRFIRERFLNIYNEIKNREPDLVISNRDEGRVIVLQFLTFEDQIK